MDQCLSSKVVVDLSRSNNLKETNTAKPRPKLQMWKLPDKNACIFCHVTSFSLKKLWNASANGASNLYGPIMEVSGTKYSAHVLCLKFASKNYQHALVSANNISCCMCKAKGASISCKFNGCSRWFHLPCFIRHHFGDKTPKNLEKLDYVCREHMNSIEGTKTFEKLNGGIRLTCPGCRQPCSRKEMNGKVNSCVEKSAAASSFSSVTCSICYSSNLPNDLNLYRSHRLCNAIICRCPSGPYISSELWPLSKRCTKCNRIYEHAKCITKSEEGIRQGRKECDYCLDSRPMTRTHRALNRFENASLIGDEKERNNNEGSDVVKETVDPPSNGAKQNENSLKEDHPSVKNVDVRCASVIDPLRSVTTRKHASEPDVEAPRRRKFKSRQQSLNGEYAQNSPRIYHHVLTYVPRALIRRNVDDSGGGSTGFVQEPELEEDYGWLRSISNNQLDDFIDVNSGEKQFMKLWNDHLLVNNPPVGDIHMENILQHFVDTHAEVLLQSLYGNFLVHVNCLIQFGIIDSNVLYRISQRLNARRTKKSNQYSSSVSVPCGRLLNGSLSVMPENKRYNSKENNHPLESTYLRKSMKRKYEEYSSSSSLVKNLSAIKSGSVIVTRKCSVKLGPDIM